MVCDACEESEWKLVVENGKATLICSSCGKKLFFPQEA
jgi:hypothetical protein